jgi:Tfp pilus assembly protein PilF
VRILPLRLLTPLRRSPRRTLVAALLILGLAAAGYAGGRALWLEHHLRAAAEALDRHDYRRAEDHLAPCLAAAPSSPRAHFLAARAARATSHWDEAEDHLRACARLGWPEDAVTLERVLLQVQRGEHRFVPYLRTRLAQGDPETLAILEVLTDEYVRTYRLRDALDTLGAYLERRSDDVQALVGRGRVWEQLFHFADAERDYRRAVEVDPDNDEARGRLAETLLVRGTPGEAAEHFERLLARRPDGPPLLFGLARARRREGRTDEARRLLGRVLEREPAHVGALTELGRLALDEGDPAEAEGLLRRAVAAAPDDVPAHAALYDCLRLAGGEEARACGEKLQRLRADLERIDALTREVGKRPDEPGPRSELGVLFLRHGEEEKGVRWLTLALELDPGYVPAHQALAAYFERTGQPERAAYHRRFAPRG